MASGSPPSLPSSTPSSAPRAWNARLSCVPRRRLSHLLRSQASRGEPRTAHGNRPVLKADVGKMLAEEWIQGLRDDAQASRHHLRVVAQEGPILLHPGPSSCLYSFDLLEVGEFSEVQLRVAERSRVRRVISSSCSQSSPTKA